MDMRWDFVKKGEHFFFGAAKTSPADFYVLIADNKTVAAICRNPHTEDSRWVILWNGRHIHRPPMEHLGGEHTLVEAKTHVENLVKPKEKT